MQSRSVISEIIKWNSDSIEGKKGNWESRIGRKWGGLVGIKLEKLILLFGVLWA